MRALITGGVGFVGTHLRAHLEACGDEVVDFDLPRDVASIEDVATSLTDAQPEVIYHLAALSHVGTSWADPSSVLRVNVMGTANVLAQARLRAPEATVIVVSSAEVYGVVDPEVQPITEAREPAPISPYAASKLAAEVLVGQAVRAYGQRALVARPFNHVGPGQNPSFFVPAMASRMLRAVCEGQSEIKVGNLTSRRDFTDVRDVVRAYRLLALHGEPGGTYNIASGTSRTMQDVAEALRERVSDELRFVTDPELLRPVDVPELCGDAGRIHALTGWKPDITWDQTLDDVVADVVVV